MTPLNAHNPQTDDAFNDLRAAIMRQAFDDWRALKKGKKIQGVTADALLRFFRGEWAQSLCGDVDPMRLLRRFEKEYAS